MSPAFLFLALMAPPDSSERDAQVQQLIEQIVQSGRVLEIGERRERVADPRKLIAPGAPPLLTFRYFAGADRHRFGKLDLMLDDAGH
jgi:hypothetical protein